MNYTKEDYLAAKLKGETTTYKSRTYFLREVDSNGFVTAQAAANGFPFYKFEETFDEWKARKEAQGL